MTITDLNQLSLGKRIAIGLLFFLPGLFFVFFMGIDTNLSCSRSLSYCTIDKVNILGIRKNVAQISLSNLKYATLDVTTSRSVGRRSGGTGYGTVLYTKNGKIKLTGFPTYDESAYIKNADKINQYIKSNDEKLDVTDSTIVIRIFGLLFTFAGFQILRSQFKK